VDLLSVQRREEDDRTILAVSGEIDVAGGTAVREAMEEAGRERVPELDLDLREVSFIDSSGLAAVLHGARTLDALGTPLRTHSPHGSEARLVIEMAGVGGILGLQE
jgi:anti-sigma B factor antagonist